MDLALLKKMQVYAPESDIIGLPDEADSQESTLIKADISIFHKIPGRDEGPELEEAVVIDAGGTVEAGADTGEVEFTEPDVPEVPKISDYDAGFEAGKANAQVMHQSTIDLLQKTVSSLQSDLDTIVKEVERAHLSFVSEAMQAAFPALIDAAVSAELVELFEQAYSQAGTGNVLMHVCPDEQKSIAALCAEKNIDIKIVANADVRPGQMRATWGQGGGDINCQEIASNCLKYVEDTLRKLT